MVTVSEQCLVAMCCFALFQKEARTSNFVLEYHNIMYRQAIELNLCTEIKCWSRWIYSEGYEKIRAVEIGNTELIPIGTFQDMNKLRYVVGVNKNIRVLASESFVNLPVLETIDLSFNLIRYIHHDVFVNVAATELILSWNKIQYFEEKFLQGLGNLKKLELSHNEIAVFSDIQRMPFLQKLNLSYNFLSALEIGSWIYPNLTVLDLSFNRLVGIAITSEIPMKKIDLTNNRLGDLYLLKVGVVDELRIAMNEFIHIPKNLFKGNVNIREISIYPNYWNCEELRQLWKKLHEHDMILQRSEDDYRIAAHNETIAICYDTKSEQRGLIEATQNSYYRKLIKDKHTPCEADNECSDEELCRNEQCFNPCKENACDSTSLCKVENHAFRCDCPTNKKRNPLIPNSRCYAAECFQHFGCPYGYICEAHLCVEAL